MNRDKRITLGLILLTLFLIAALFAPLLAPYDPFDQQLKEGLAPPSAEHPLGQDKLGRDLLSRILYGARISLWVGVATVTISLTIGCLVGAMAGFFGGWLDELFMRLVDIFLAFPGILLAIALAAVLGPSLRNVIIALSVMGWVGYARLVRGQILVVRELDYVAAARALGAGPLRIITRHLFPNIAAPIIVEATFGIAGAIVTEASLSFLGLGVTPPTPSWGAMLSDGRSFLLLAPHLTAVPGLAIMSVVMALNLLGDGLRDRMDVKSR
ncbi:nickel transporter permease [Candidatus Manganitrophus noduliformans]|uniref:ABC transporter permease n=1 Tax=Candidatus Manganitrophus noduliformans TaxID=2606439 RepID=A0A7X6I915_9BACT|nr:nickel transporter permease [Candidatus Manganitrophus noduliformans]NKE69221.1 ABC transporter permease [Candidatus Manganitrophus noduliformans]